MLEFNNFKEKKLYVSLLCLLVFIDVCLKQQAGEVCFLLIVPRDFSFSLSVFERKNVRMMLE